MPIPRREFVSTAASLAGLAAVAPASTFPADPLGVRPDFPILANGRTYLNSAYITPSPRSVLAAGTAFLQAKANRPMTVAELLSKANEVRGQFARLINATPEEIGLLFATSEGENVMANTAPMNAGDNVVVDSLHYEGALVAHRQLEARRGIELRIVEHRDGLVTTEDIARRVDPRTRLTSVSCSAGSAWRRFFFAGISSIGWLRIGTASSASSPRPRITASRSAPTPGATTTPRFHSPRCTS